MGTVPSVKVKVLDDEHEQCTAAINELVQDRSAASLQRVLDVFAAHFSHEEALLDEHLYAETLHTSGGFSADRNARTSHMQDHERILSSLRKMLRACGEDAVPPSYVKLVQQEFAGHAEMYDGHYAERLALKMA